MNKNILKAIVPSLLVSLAIFTGCNIDGIGPITPIPTPVPIMTPGPTPTATPVPSATPTTIPTSSPSPTLGWASIYFSQVGGTTEEVNEDNIDHKLISQLDKATKTIKAALFEVDSEIIADAFISAKNRGVKVQIVTDTDYIEEEALIKLKDAGITIVDDNRSSLMHNKFIVIDGQYVWTGSFNTTFNDANRNNNNAILISSAELAENYTAEFNEMFTDKQFGPTSDPKIVHDKVVMSDGTEISTFFSPENNADQAIIDEITKATSSVYFMAFSFTHDGIGDAMITRSKNGVEVKGVFEKRGATTTYSEYPKMLDEGLGVKLDSNPYNLHHKVIIIDGKTVLSGSFNFSENATSRNDENLIIIRNNPLVAQAYTQEFNLLYSTGTN